MTGKTLEPSHRPAEAPSSSQAHQDESTRFRSVLVGVDGRPAGHDAIALGAMLCAPDGRLTLAHVSLTNSSTYLSADTDAATAQSLEMLQRERERAAVIAELRDIRSLSVGRGLHQLAEESAADLLVVGSCSRGFLGRVFIGDDTRASLNGASCAVAVAPHGYADLAASIKTVGVAYNGTIEADAALTVARDLAARYEAKIRAMTVIPVPGGVGYWEAFDWSAATDAVEQAANERLRSLDDVDGSVAVGIPSEALAAFGAEVDLLVVGSRSYGPIRRMMLGSTSEHLARSARCPLLVLPRPVVARHEHEKN
jgi:nucleotide-binding universal stress UspA family protein